MRNSTWHSVSSGKSFTAETKNNNKNINNYEVRNCACVDQPTSGVASRWRNQRHEYQSKTSISPGLATPDVASSLGLAYDRVMNMGPGAVCMTQS